ncbi:hypothetical protein ACEPAI_4281 [Sanghuangporus weigelae]
MSPEEIESSMYPSPAFTGRSDALLLETGIQHGLFRELKDAMIYRRTSTTSSDDFGAWDNAKAELEAAKTLGKPVTRQVEFVRVEGANHFMSFRSSKTWKERALRAFLDDNIQEPLVTMDQLK